MKVLVTGGLGQLAEAVRKTWTAHELVIPAEEDLDLSSRERIEANLSIHRPQVVLNTGAFTQVDRCESEPELAERINGEAVGWLAKACSNHRALLVQISTDYVFDGGAVRPYLETDLPNPPSSYGRSKLRGEREAAQALEHLIVRTSWLYDASGKNFYNTMLRAASEGRKLRVVDDQRGAPTTCRALARQLECAVEEGWRGLVHATCSGETTWYDFAAAIFRRNSLAANLSPCSTLEYPLPAPRPAYSVLDGRHRSDLGTDLMPSWEDALAEVVADSRNRGEHG